MNRDHDSFTVLAIGAASRNDPQWIVKARDGDCPEGFGPHYEVWSGGGTIALTGHLPDLLAWAASLHEALAWEDIMIRAQSGPDSPGKD